MKKRTAIGSPDDGFRLLDVAPTLLTDKMDGDG
jgi:hypothetical protein